MKRKAAAKMVKVLGRSVRFGSKRFHALVAQKKHFDELAGSETGRGRANPGRPGDAFKRCVKEVSKRPGVYSPRGVCASAGRAKYGAQPFAEMAAAGRRRAARGNPDGLSLASLTLLDHHGKDAGAEWWKAKGRPAPSSAIDAAFRKSLRHVAGEVGRVSAADKKQLRGVFFRSFRDAGRNPAGGRRKSRANPADGAARMYEEFHGKASTGFQEYKQETHEHEYLADLGRLVYLIFSVGGGEGVKLEGFHGVRVACSEDGGQLYFVGGAMPLDLEAMGFGSDLPKDHVVIGECVEICYHTVKGFHDFQPIDYYHKLGERGGVPPILNYDVRSERAYLTGGSYQVKPEGIVN